MNTNFDYLLENELYETFAQQAVEAEKSLTVSPSTCAILCRRALELAVRFVYSYDSELELPYRDNISSLIHESSFRNIIEPRLFPLLKYIIKLGNEAVHTNHLPSFFSQRHFQVYSQVVAIQPISHKLQVAQTDY